MFDLIDGFPQRVLAWFDINGRKELPWQQNKTVYRVWISEIMLQQTQVATVIPYYQRFMQTFPDVTALAKASEDAVLSHWSGLGYYARARNLHKAAKKVVFEMDGEFPISNEGLCELPGIGRSTAAAILSIVHDLPEAILDGNVKRVLARLHAVPMWPGDTITQRQLWDLAESYMPAERCGDYTQAMMDIGATLCTRSKPQCLLCPFMQDCQAKSQGDSTRFPVRKIKKEKPIKEIYLLVLKDTKENILFEKRPSVGIWGGLWSLPELTHLKDLMLDVSQRFLGEVTHHKVLTCFKHTFSHYHLMITPVIVEGVFSDGIHESAKYQWFNPSDVSALGLPAPVRKILDANVKSDVTYFGNGN